MVEKRTYVPICYINRIVPTVRENYSVGIQHVHVHNNWHPDAEGDGTWMVRMRRGGRSYYYYYIGTVYL